MEMEMSERAAILSALSEMAQWNSADGMPFTYSDARIIAREDSYFATTGMDA